MDIQQFKSKKRNDLLASTIDEFLESNSEEMFYFLMGQKLRGGKGKTYKNFDKKLPFGRNYQELEVNGPQDSRRIVIDTENFEIYATRDHYETMAYAGKPSWSIKN